MTVDARGEAQAAGRVDACSARRSGRVDMAAMVTGRFEFVHNVRVPGMLHGARRAAAGRRRDARERRRELGRAICPAS